MLKKLYYFNFCKSVFIYSNRKARCNKKQRMEIVKKVFYAVLQLEKKKVYAIIH